MLLPCIIRSAEEFENNRSKTEHNPNLILSEIDTAKSAINSTSVNNAPISFLENASNKQ